VEVLPAVPARKIFIPCGFSALYQQKFKAYFEQMPRWLKSFDALVFYANEYRDIGFAKSHGIKNIIVIPNGADEREFDGGDGAQFRAKHAIADNEMLLMTVGSLTGLKGHWEVARAFELAQFSEHTTLILNGNEPERSSLGKLKQLARHAVRGRSSLGAVVKRINAQQAGSKRVILCDFPRAELVCAFKASNLFVFASYVEYSPLVLFEAVAAGTAFLSSPAGNAAEIAAWTQGGEVFPCPSDKDGFLEPDPLLLAKHMTAIATDRAKLQEMGLQGRAAFVSGGFSWEKIALQYEAILTKPLTQL